MSRFGARLMALLSLIFPATAHAVAPSGAEVSGGSIRLSWAAPAACPTEADVRATAERLLNRSLDTPLNQDISAEARVRRTPTGNWQVRFWLTSNGQFSEETLLAKRCRSLADAVALKLALAVDPFAVAESLQAPPSADEGPATQTTTIDREQRPTEMRESGVSLDVTLRLSAGAGSGPLPGPNPAGLLVAGVGRAPWRIEFGIFGLLGQTAEHPTVSQVGADVDLLGSVVRGCWMTSLETVSVPLCVGAELGAVRGRGVGLAEIDVSYSLWGAAQAAVALKVPLAPGLSLWVEGSGILTLARPSFAAENLSTIYRAPRLGGRGWAGLELALN